MRQLTEPHLSVLHLMRTSPTPSAVADNVLLRGALPKATVFGQLSEIVVVCSLPSALLEQATSFEFFGHGQAHRSGS
jgi:hypothetical protein